MPRQGQPPDDLLAAATDVRRAARSHSARSRGGIALLHDLLFSSVPPRPMSCGGPSRTTWTPDPACIGGWRDDRPSLARPRGCERYRCGPGGASRHRRRVCALRVECAFRQARAVVRFQRSFQRGEHVSWHPLLPEWMVELEAAYLRTGWISSWRALCAGFVQLSERVGQ